MTPISGACLCGAITVVVDDIAGPLMFCHCRECRKSTGAPFLAVLPVPLVAFHLRDPRQQLRGYRASAHKLRSFCGTCGSPLYSQRDGADAVRVRAGLLELPADIALGGHIYCGDAAAWDEIHDSLPRHAGIEPGRTPIIANKD